MAAVLPQLSYTRREAAAATGLSYDVISAACRSGDLREVQPEVNGRKIDKRLIMRTDLEEWLRGGR